MMGAERKSAVITEESRKLTAYHEGGHAIVACFTDGALPVHKATVVPRGMALGMVCMYVTHTHTHTLTHTQIHVCVCVCVCVCV
jgi:ATP-dependent metalloprotease